MRHSLAPHWNHDAGSSSSSWVLGLFFGARRRCCPSALDAAFLPLRLALFRLSIATSNETTTRPGHKGDTATHWEPEFSRPFPRKSASGCGGGLGLFGLFLPVCGGLARAICASTVRFTLSSPLLVFSSALLSSPCSRTLPAPCVRQIKYLPTCSHSTWLVHERPPAVKAKFAVIGTTSGVTLDRSGHGLCD